MPTSPCVEVRARRVRSQAHGGRVVHRCRGIAELEAVFEAGAGVDLVVPRDIVRDPFHTDRGECSNDRGIEDPDDLHRGAVVVYSVRGVVCAANGGEGGEGR